jgi:subtilisin family serine protease
MRTPRLLAFLTLVAVAFAFRGSSSLTAQGRSAGGASYVVVYAEDATAAEARAALAALGATVVRENTAIGVANVESRVDLLSLVGSQPALLGAARNRPVGRGFDRSFRKLDDADLDRLDAAALALGARPASGADTPAAEPLAERQWDMAMIHATATESYARQLGDARVRVGILDTGIDATHPDLAPNVSITLSRNFTTDIPSIDGPCEVPSCVDSPLVDDNEHGTHVAGTVAAKLNGLGIAGVAPNVTLVNIRGGQDSGFFFLQPVVDALVYAGDIGIDVVNMSFFVDPWLYNCANNPADLPGAQLEQRTIVAALQRALDYARSRGVTLVAALGNEHTDLGFPTTDTISPDFPIGASYPRTVDNTCLVMPTEGRGVIAVSSLGPSGTKADYSNYGVEQTDVSAPGGYFRDFFGTPQHRTVENLVLSTYPRALAQERGELNPDGSPNTPFVIRDCQGSVCGYYQYLQGTSMAAPHAAGVAALIVSERGHRDPRPNRGLTLNPAAATAMLQATATPTACPNPRLLDYTIVGRPPEFNAFCDGSLDFNGFYGHGIVNALRAVLPSSQTEDEQ